MLNIIRGEGNLLKFDLKNKLRSDKGNESKSESNDETNSAVESSLKNEMLKSIMKAGSSGEEDTTVTFADISEVEEELSPKSKEESEASPKNQEAQLEEKLVAKVEEKLKAKIEEKLSTQVETPQNKPQLQTEVVTKSSPKQVSPESAKISQLIKAIETSNEKMITPIIDLGQNKITYPILEQIGESPDNLDFLEKLTSENFDILKRTVYERFAVCPEHPESMSTTIRLNCPRCSSMDISKLHLIEHKRCGYISENKNFETSDDGTIISCPSCKKTN